MSDILQRLRLLVPSDSSGAAIEAADTNAALTARVEELEGALAKMQRSRDRYRQAWEAEKVASAAITKGESHD